MGTNFRYTPQKEIAMEKPTQAEIDQAIRNREAKKLTAFGPQRASSWKQ